MSLRVRGPVTQAAPGVVPGVSCADLQQVPHLKARKHPICQTETLQCGSTLKTHIIYSRAQNALAFPLLGLLIDMGGECPASGVYHVWRAEVELPHSFSCKSSITDEVEHHFVGPLAIWTRLPLCACSFSYWVVPLFLTDW